MRLMLYHYDSCPYCERVRSAARTLGLVLELRNIHESAEHLADLRRATGRSTVPVLRIIGFGEHEEWMPESSDIVDFLRRNVDLLKR